MILKLKNIFLTKPLILILIFISTAQANNDAAISRYSSMEADVRVSLQRALIWNGVYVGISDGQITTRTINAIRSFQGELGQAQTGFLTSPQVKILLERANLQQSDMGYRRFNDTNTGISIGLPYKFIANAHNYKRGMRFVSRNEDLDIVTMAVPLSERSFEDFYLSHVNKQGRTVDYKVFRGDWFVVNGFENGKHFYIRAHKHVTSSVEQIRGYAISYDARYASQLSRLMTIMSSDFKKDSTQLSVAEARIDWSNMPRGFEPKTQITQAPPSPPVAASTPIVTVPAPATGGVDVPVKSEISYGTGFFITSQGHFITNAHVVEECKEIAISPLGRASMIDRDKINDLALIKLETGATTKPLQISKISPRLGDDVVVLGFPLQTILQNGLNLTTGNISSLAGLGGDSRFVQISAALQQGNSGGPLLNREGMVIGVTAAKLNALKVASNTGDIPQNVNFAIRSEILEVYLRRHSVEITLKDAGSEKPNLADMVDTAKASIFPVLCTK